MADAIALTWPDGRPLTGRSLTSYLKFAARLEELGATLTEPHWLGALEPHRVTCHKSHECAPTPSNANAGNGICQVCANRDSGAAEAKFRGIVAKAGGTVLGKYQGAHVRVDVRCAAEHVCSPVPAKVNAGASVCPICYLESRRQSTPQRSRDSSASARRQSTPRQTRSSSASKASSGGLKKASRVTQAAKEAFYDAVSSGRGVVEGTYVNTDTPVAVRCKRDHLNYPRPGSILAGRHFCRRCAFGSDEVEALFYMTVEKLGGRVTGEYLSVNHKVEVTCRLEHVGNALPSAVLAGVGFCRPCTGKVWDAFYVVSNGDTIKFGVTSGLPKGRLKNHRRDGYRTTHLTLESLPAGEAHKLEQSLIKQLMERGFRPVKGREYYHASALPHVLSAARAVADRLGSTLALAPGETA